MMAKLALVPLPPWVPGPHLFLQLLCHFLQDALPDKGTREGPPDTHHLFHLLLIGLGVLIPFIRGHQQALLMALHVTKNDTAALLLGMA